MDANAVTPPSCGICNAARKVTPAGQVVSGLECRANPPQLVSMIIMQGNQLGSGVTALYPAVKADGWCREYQQAAALIATNE